MKPILRVFARSLLVVALLVCPACVGGLAVCRGGSCSVSGNR